MPLFILGSACLPASIPQHGKAVKYLLGLVVAHPLFFEKLIGILLHVHVSWGIGWQFEGNLHVDFWHFFPESPSTSAPPASNLCLSSLVRLQYYAWPLVSIIDLESLFYKKNDYIWNLLHGFSSLKECSPRHSIFIDCFPVPHTSKFVCFCLIPVVVPLESAKLIHFLHTLEVEVLYLFLHPGILLMLSLLL